MQGQEKPPPPNAVFILLPTSLPSMNADWHDISFLLPSQSKSVTKIIGKEIYFNKGKIIGGSNA